MSAIDWPAFGLVLVTALTSAVVTVALVAVGVRLLATPPRDAVVDVEPEPDDQGEDDPTTPAESRPFWATAGAIGVFALAAVVVGSGVVLIVH